MKMNGMMAESMIITACFLRVTPGRGHPSAILRLIVDAPSNLKGFDDDAGTWPRELESHISLGYG